jgi:hypothetical protein
VDTWFSPTADDQQIVVNLGPLAVGMHGTVSVSQNVGGSDVPIGSPLSISSGVVHYAVQLPALAGLGEVHLSIQGGGFYIYSVGLEAGVAPSTPTSVGSATVTPTPGTPSPTPTGPTPVATAVDCRYVVGNMVNDCQFRGAGGDGSPNPWSADDGANAMAPVIDDESGMLVAGAKDERFAVGYARAIHQGDAYSYIRAGAVLSVTWLQRTLPIPGLGASLPRFYVTVEQGSSYDYDTGPYDFGGGDTGWQVRSSTINSTLSGGQNFRFETDNTQYYTYFTNMAIVCVSGCVYPTATALPGTATPYPTYTPYPTSTPGVHTTSGPTVVAAATNTPRPAGTQTAVAVYQTVEAACWSSESSCATAQAAATAAGVTTIITGTGPVSVTVIVNNNTDCGLICSCLALVTAAITSVGGSITGAISGGFAAIMPASDCATGPAAIFEPCSLVTDVAPLSTDVEAPLSAITNSMTELGTLFPDGAQCAKFGGFDAWAGNSYLAAHGNHPLTMTIDMCAWGPVDEAGNPIWPPRIRQWLLLVATVPVAMWMVRYWRSLPMAGRGVGEL